MYGLSENALIRLVTSKNGNELFAFLGKQMNVLENWRVEIGY